MASLLEPGPVQSERKPAKTASENVRINTDIGNNRPAYICRNTRHRPVLFHVHDQIINIR